MHSHSAHRAPAGSALKPRYSAKHMVKPVQFFCHATEARQVCIMGEFNQWNPTAHPMTRMPDGVWRVEVLLHHGHHPYVFVVDGQLMLDPRAQGVTRNAKGERVSLIAVS